MVLWLCRRRLAGPDGWLGERPPRRTTRRFGDTGGDIEGGDIILRIGTVGDSAADTGIRPAWIIDLVVDDGGLLRLSRALRAHRPVAATAATA